MGERVLLSLIATTNSETLDWHVGQTIKLSGRNVGQLFYLHKGDTMKKLLILVTALMVSACGGDNYVRVDTADLSRNFSSDHNKSASDLYTSTMVWFAKNTQAGSSVVHSDKDECLIVGDGITMVVEQGGLMNVPMHVNFKYMMSCDDNSVRLSFDNYRYENGLAVTYKSHLDQINNNVAEMADHFEEELLRIAN